MGKLVTLANSDSTGLFDIPTVNTANSNGIQLNSLRAFNQKLLETDLWRNEKGHYPAYSSKWVVSEARNKKIDKSGIIERTYDADGIRRITDLNALDLSQYIGEKNVAFFFDQDPNIGGGSRIWNSSKRANLRSL